jgi:hypothetical protein
MISIGVRCDMDMVSPAGMAAARLPDRSSSNVVRKRIAALPAELFRFFSACYVAIFVLSMSRHATPSSI